MRKIAVTAAAAMLLAVGAQAQTLLTAPGENALWFMYEPVLMSKGSFARLNKAQHDALIAAARKSEA